MSATDALNQISDAMEVTAELPLRVFDIKITRKDNGRTCIKLTRGAEVLEVTGKFGKRIKIDQLLINSEANGLRYATAMCPTLIQVNSFTRFVHCTADGQGEWKPLDPLFTTPPSEKAVKAFHTAMKNVAERILTRFSRVDLL